MGYRNTLFGFRRPILHVTFWLLILFWMHLCIYLFFGTGLEKDIKLHNSLPFWIITIANHYLVCYVLLPVFQKGKIHWVIPLLSGVILYFISSVLCSWAVYMLAKYQPENAFLQIVYENFKTESWTGVFERSGFRLSLNLVTIYNLISISLKVGIDHKKTQQEKLRLEQEEHQMEAALLRTKIRPNVLLKQLDYLRSLVCENPQALKTIDQLTGLMHFSLYESSEPYISLKKEAAFLQDYIDLELLRHRKELLDLQFECPHELSDNTIKPLLLVNLVENAFKHGVHVSPEKAFVRVLMQERDNGLLFQVINSKPTHPASREKSNQGGIGLANVRRRLVLEYPDRHTLTIQEGADTFDATLTIMLS